MALAKAGSLMGFNNHILSQNAFRQHTDVESVTVHEVVDQRKRAHPGLVTASIEMERGGRVFRSHSFIAATMSLHHNRSLSCLLYKDRSYCISQCID